MQFSLASASKLVASRSTRSVVDSSRSPRGSLSATPAVTWPDVLADAPSASLRVISECGDAPKLRPNAPALSRVVEFVGCVCTVRCAADCVECVHAAASLSRVILLLLSRVDGSKVVAVLLVTRSSAGRPCASLPAAVAAAAAAAWPRAALQNAEHRLSRICVAFACGSGSMRFWSRTRSSAASKPGSDTYDRRHEGVAERLQRAERHEMVTRYSSCQNACTSAGTADSASRNALQTQYCHAER